MQMRKDLQFGPASNRFRYSPTCPCGKSNRDGKFCPDKIDPNAGYCHSCGKTFFGDKEASLKIIKPLPPGTIPPAQHPYKLMMGTLKHYNNNNFIAFCKSLFPDRDVAGHAKTYGIGTSNLNQGKSTIFWQIDMDCKVRAGKIIKYDACTGKRQQHSVLARNVTWVHKACKVENFNLKQCLFGLHLTTGNNKTIAVVESEKTAFLMSLIDESRIWVATGGKENFKYDLLIDLKGRNVLAYPDNGEFENWKAKALKLGIYGINIFVSDILEEPTLPNGWDLADQLIHSI